MCLCGYKISRPKFSVKAPTSGILRQRSRPGEINALDHYSQGTKHTTCVPALDHYSQGTKHTTRVPTILRTISSTSKHLTFCCCCSSYVQNHATNTRHNIYSHASHFQFHTKAIPRIRDTAQTLHHSYPHNVTNKHCITKVLSSSNNTSTVHA